MHDVDRIQGEVQKAGGKILIEQLTKLHKKNMGERTSATKLEKRVLSWQYEKG